MSARDLTVSVAVPLVVAQAPADAYTLTAGRVWSLAGAALGLAGVTIGALALARSTGRIGRGPGSRGAAVSLLLGLVGAVVGGVVVAAADGGPGSGSGIVGGLVAVVVGLTATILGGLTLVRSRRTARPADVPTGSRTV